jgi:hypothetical protein
VNLRADRQQNSQQRSREVRSRAIKPAELRWGKKQ